MGNTEVKTEEKKSWIKKHPIWSLVILLVVLNLLFLGAILPDTEKNNSSNSNINSQNNYQSSNTANVIKEETTATSKSWHDITSFDGTNSKKTDTFHIQGDKFKLIYNVNPANEYSAFYLTIYREGDTYMADSVSLDSGSDESIIYEGKGNFYLDINAANLDDWEVKVEDYY